MHNVINYDVVTGNFTWKVGNNRRVKAGDTAGTITKAGYRQILYKGKMHKASRLAFTLIGIDPTGKVVDHINGDRDDNRLENLRLTTYQENALNRSIHRAGQLAGVTLDRGKWKVQHRGKYVGRFSTEQEAHEAYLNVKEIF